MMMKRGKFVVGIMVFANLALWAGTLLLFKLTFFESRYWQLNYLLISIGVLLLTLVITYYTNGLGRLAIKKKSITAYSLFNQPLISVPLNEIEGYAITENKAKGVTVFELIIQIHGRTRFISLLGLVGEVGGIKKRLGKDRHRAELVKQSFRRDVKIIGSMFIMLGVLGGCGLMIKEEAVKESVDNISRFEVSISDYNINSSTKSGWTETYLVDIENDRFHYKVDNPYFTEEEMIVLVDRLDKGTKTLSIWTHEQSYRHKILDGQVELSFYEKHFNYDVIPVFQAADGKDVFGDMLRGGDKKEVSNMALYTLCAIAFFGGLLMVWWGMNRSRK